jgi:hypothetical protein
MEKEYISGDIENVERYPGELFQVPVGVCIADTQDIVRGALGYEISDMRREPHSDCVTGFQYVARIEWAPWNDGDSWRLMYAVKATIGPSLQSLWKKLSDDRCSRCRSKFNVTLITIFRNSSRQPAESGSCSEG